MKFFLHIIKQVKGKNSREKFLTGSAQIFLYACFSFRLSPRLNIDNRITKIGTNDCYHEYNTGLKIPHCQSKMAAKNRRWPTRNSVFDIFASYFLESDKIQRTKKLSGNVLNM